MSNSESLARLGALYSHAKITDLAADSNWPSQISCSRSQKFGDRVVLPSRGSGAIWIEAKSWMI